MESWKILYSKWNNDECYTPEYWVLPIIKYIPKYKKRTCDIVDLNYIEQGAIYYFNNRYTDLLIEDEREDKICITTPLSDWTSSHYVINKNAVKFNNIYNIIRCPFDTKESNFVKMLSKRWFKVISSHIDEWKDFFEYEPEERDIMISNPPFTWKRKIFERALSFWKPFALLMSNTWLNDSAPKQLFKDKDLQLLMFDKRIEYNWHKKITFSSSYYCWNLLPKQIIMEYIIK